MSQAPAGSEPAEVALLTGTAAASVLAAALLPQRQQLQDWRVHSVHHRPGAGVTVGYTVTVRELDGSTSTQYLCASTAKLSHFAGPELLQINPADVGGATVHVWRHPADPELPALPTACTPALLSARLGINVEATMVAYRPTRRAVVQVKFPDGSTAYAKVLRPNQAASLAQRHRILQASGVPSPEVLRADPDGLVLLSTGQGTPLSGLLSRGMTDEQAARVFGALTGLLDALPVTALQLPSRPAWSDRVHHYAHAAATVLPEHTDRIRLISRGVEELRTSTNPGALVPTHGDFYEANVLMAGERVACLLDADSLGPGYRVDDLACLLGHVSVLDHLAPQSYPRVRTTLDTWTALADQQVDPVALRVRCAGVVLSLVAGARREDGADWRPDAEGRLARAETWLAQAREIQARRSHS